MVEQILKKIQELLKIILDGFLLECTFEVIRETDQYRIVIYCLDKQDVSRIWGKDGEILSALQHILRTLIHKSFPNYKIHFLLDLEKIKKGREEILQDRIPQVADDLVLKKGKIVVLVGLSGYERLIVHNILRNIKGLETQSVGVGDQRKLLILPTSEIGSQGIEESIILDIDKLKQMVF